MANEKSSTVTTGMRVGDTEASRIQTGREATVSDQGRQAQPANPSAGKDGINAGLTVGSQIPAPVAKPVDFRTITGSYAGDHRSNPGDVAKSSLDSCADNGGPRKDVGQFKGSKSETQPATQSFAGDLADSDAGN